MPTAIPPPRSCGALATRFSEDGTRRTALDLLGLPGFGFDVLEVLEPELSAIDAETRTQLGREMIYAAYLQRQENQIASLRADEARAIPDGIDYRTINGLSRELAEKLSRARPKTMAQAGRIDGMTPAALVLVLARVQSLPSRARA